MIFKIAIFEQGLKIISIPVTVKTRLKKFTSFELEVVDSNDKNKNDGMLVFPLVC